MRRKDREMNKDFALMVVDKCEYAVLSMVTKDNMPYCIPITIVRDGDYIYFHSSKDGYKIETLNNNDNLCLSCVGDTKISKDKFTTEFESAIVRGKAKEITDENLKIYALKILSQRHTPTNMHNFDDAIKKSLFRTGVWSIKITDITGKRKKYDKNGIEMKFGRME